MLELNKNELKNAARSIREHNRIHSRKEPNAFFIAQYLEIAADLFEKIADGKIFLTTKQPRTEKIAYWIELPRALNPEERPCKCSDCGHILSFYGTYPKSNFCPNCGAQMEN